MNSVLKLVVANIYRSLGGTLWRICFSSSNRKVNDFGTYIWIKSHNYKAEVIGSIVYDYVKPIEWRGFNFSKGTVQLSEKIEK